MTYKISRSGWLDYCVVFSRKKKALGKKDGHHCFCCCKPTISHRVIDHFIGEIINVILHFCKFFNLFQNFSRLDQFKKISAEKYVELRKQKKNGYNS